MLPTNILYKAGERVNTYAGGGQSRLENRMKRLFREEG